MFTRFAKFFLFISIFVAAAGLGTYLTINILIRSDKHVVVPDLEGKDVVYALEVLSDLGLNAKIKTSEFHPNVPKHRIIDQFPEPGTEIKSGRDVRLVISKGMRSVVFPNVRGMDFPMANIIIEENDLRRRAISYTYSHSQGKGTVMAQYPKSGTQGVRGDAIDLLISAGPPTQWLRMMDLKGMMLNNAAETIEKNQLSVGTVRQINSTEFLTDTVVKQSPKHGFPVIAGTAVELTINQPYPKKIGGQLREIALFRYRTSHGYLRQKVRVRISRADIAFDIFNDFVKPGREVLLMVTRDAPATLFVYIDDELTKIKYYD